MRFIPPPAATPGELMFSAMMELLSDKDAYKKRFDDLKVLKADASKAVKENNDQIKQIDEWEKSHEARAEKLDRRETEINSTKDALDAMQSGLDRDKTLFKKEQDNAKELLDGKFDEIEKTRKSSVTERNRVIKESAALDVEIERIAKDRAKLNEDIAAFNEKQNRIKLAIAS